MKQKSGTFSAQFRLETVMEVLRGEKSVAQVCRELDMPSYGNLDQIRLNPN